MSALPGYRDLALIYESTRTGVYRGVRASDDCRVAIKLMRNEYPSFQQLVQFRNQYAIAKNLNLAGVVRPYSLENYRNGYAIVVEDFGGISLKEWMERWGKKGMGAVLPEGLKDFLWIAIAIADTLAAIHKARVIHKDIKPANLLINPETKQVKITDFSIASLLPKENQILSCGNALEGTLAYLSPEQTGRMNRGIDYRSDFYSLGITFYELLTGQLPFPTSDPMELVHCHLAKQPLVINHINPDLPQVISDIVNKLMAKMAEDRYQSGLGLKHDLEKCLHQWETKIEIIPFELGKRDIADRFLIPEKLYGRENEVKTLLSAFDRVSAGTKEMLLVAGYSGIGKTAVVNEIHKPIVRQRGYFIRGKFDQFGHNVPFSAFGQAFRDLIGQILSESTQQVEQWQTQILDAVGQQGRVIIDVIPELKLLIGEQPSVPELEPSASQNRFNLLFQKFLQVFTTPSHPLAIFLDDLQWADGASLKLIQSLMNDENTYLLVIGACRDNEVYPAHPLMQILDEINKTQTPINTINLPPLSQEDLNCSIADTLSCPLEIALPFSQLVYAKTQGNPFFSNQFLKSLYEDGLITFNFEARYWQCDIARVKALSLTDDVVEFMAIQLQKLPEDTREVLKIAACIGNSFDLNTLGIVYEKSSVETATSLWKALQEGLIIPQNEIYKFFHDEESEVRNQELESENYSDSCNYKFSHDRVQQAAYSLIPEDQKQSTHLKIGERLLKNTSNEERSEKIFELVNQLNLAQSLILNQFARNELAELNLIAGCKAKASTAYTAALEYLTVGITLLAPDSWETEYHLTLSLYESATEAAYLTGNFEQMSHLASVVLAQAQSILDTVKVYEVQIQAGQAQNQPLESVNVALQILKLLGVSFPASPSQSDVGEGLEEIKSLLAGKKPLELIALSPMTDSNKLAAMRILSTVFAAAYAATPGLFPLIVFKQVNLSIQYGNTSFSAFGYACYGLILCGVVGDINTGYEFGKLALKLLEKFHAKELQARTFEIVNCGTRLWKEHIKDTLPSLREGYQSGLETGDLEWACLCAMVYTFHSYFMGKELIGLEREIAAFSTQMSRLNQQTLLNQVKIYHQSVLNLVGHSVNSWRLAGEVYDEEKMLEVHRQAGDRTGLYFFYLNKIILCYFSGEIDRAVENAALAENYLACGTGMLVVPMFHFYDSLSHLARYSRASNEKRQEIQKRIIANQEKMQKWAQYAPMNYLHKFYLIEAENCRVLGNFIEAVENYDRAISLAKTNEYIQEEALANELAAKFYLAWGKDKIARPYMIDAYYGYAHWGSLAKVEDLENCYPELLAPILQPEKIDFDHGEITSSQATKTLNSNSTSISDSLDLATVVKASLALSGEIQLDKLLSTMMELVMENAGAFKSALILSERDRLSLAAIAVNSNSTGKPKTILLPSIPLEESGDVPLTPINYVKNTKETLAIDNVTTYPSFRFDSYIQRQQPKSLLCTPLLHQGQLIGILYLENNLIAGAFTKDRLEIIQILTSQAAISLQNARLYQESQNHAKQLEEAYQKSQQAQLQMIQNEKMAALGQLMAGIAHEINNPVGFISANIEPALEYIQNLIAHLLLYHQYYPNPVPEIEENAEEIELAFLLEDLPKTIAAMKQGTERIRSISNSMRVFSRSDTSKKVPFNVHEGIDSTLLILRHRLKANETRPEIEVLKNYGDLPKINCYPGQLNQVIINLIANGIDALEEASQGKSYQEIEQRHNRITIATEIDLDRSYIKISITDNGIGMNEEIKARVFDHLFTTKPVGKGTGLGLSIVRQIVEKEHCGQVTCNSSIGRGTEFSIMIPIQ